MPGTAALAIMADQMMQFGAVRWLSKIVGLNVSGKLMEGRLGAYEWRSDGTTETFMARPVRS